MLGVGVDGGQPIGDAEELDTPAGRRRWQTRTPSTSKLASCSGELVKNARGASAPISSGKSKGTFARSRS